MMEITATRYHDFSAGHRVLGHEGKCRFLHGHNYRVHFTVAQAGQGLDSIGRVLDFSAIKSRLCQWLEDNWDHKMLLWKEDPYVAVLEHPLGSAILLGDPSVVLVPFNPTAENMASFLLRTIGPAVLPKGLVLTNVTVEETRKCLATASL